MGRAFRYLALAVMTGASVSCGDAVTQSRSPMLLVVNTLEGAPTGGHGANTFTGNLLSDVAVVSTDPACNVPSPPASCITVFNDVGRVTLASQPKNISIAPTSNNQVTLTRYHVEYKRADGLNTQGTYVPFSFDGAVTGTVPPEGTVQLTFELVRHTAKEESPLVQLRNSLQIIHAIAYVTFYGQDLVGNAISVTGSMSVDFGNFGDQ